MNCERIEVTTTDGTAWLDRLTPRQMLTIGARMALDIISVASESPNAENAGGLPESFVGSSEEAMRIAIQLVGAEIESESSSKSKKKK